MHAVSPRARRPLTLRPGFSREASQARRRLARARGSRRRGGGRRSGTCAQASRLLQRAGSLRDDGSRERRTSSPGDPATAASHTGRDRSPPDSPPRCSHGGAPSPTSQRRPKTPGLWRPTIRRRTREPLLQPGPLDHRRPVSPEPPDQARASPAPGTGICGTKRFPRERPAPYPGARPPPPPPRASPTSALALTTGAGRPLGVQKPGPWRPRSRLRVLGLLPDSVPKGSCRTPPRSRPTRRRPSPTQRAGTLRLSACWV